VGPLQKRYNVAVKPLPFAKGGDRGEGMLIHISFRKSGRLHTNVCCGKMGIGRAILADRFVPHALSHVWRRQRKRICDLEKVIIIIKDTYTKEFASVLDYKKLLP